MTFDLLIFAGKIKKAPLGYIFSGVNKKLLLQSHVRPTRCTKSFQKNPDFETIYHFLVDSYHTLPWSQAFFLIVATRVHCFVALLQLSHAVKNQGKPL